MSKVLLIEDDHFLSSLLRSKFQKEGFEVFYAMDGDEALNILRTTKEKMDIILLDLILPKKSGFEVMTEIRNDPQLQYGNIPIVIISNLGQPEDVERAKSLGAVAYFVKAKTSINDLVEKVKEFIAAAQK